VFLFVCLCPVSGVPNVDSISVLCFLFVCLCPVSGVPNVDRYCQHWVHQTQNKDKQTKNTTQRYCQHWVQQTQDKDKQSKTQHRDTVNIGYSLCPVSGVPNVDSIYVLCFCLFVFVLCLVYPMLTVSLCCVFVCLSLSCVWCTQC
jgi:Flp pilus assembly protein TadB